MPDITMCSSIKCPWKDKCYRHESKHISQWQSWSNFEYTCNENSGFDMFIPNNKEGCN